MKKRTTMSTTLRSGKAKLDSNGKHQEEEPFLEQNGTNKTKHIQCQKDVHFAKRDSTPLYKAQLMAASMLACCLNMAFQEALLRMLPKASNFISFVQHIFITIVSICSLGLPFGLFGAKPPKIPVRSYLGLMFLNLTMVLANNASLNYGVSIPLNMIFKSSSLIANMFLGMLILSHRYPVGKYLSVVLITSGLIMCTFEDYRLKQASALSSSSSNDSLHTSATTSKPTSSNPSDLFSQTIGIIFLTLSLLLSSGTGIYQEYLRNKFGKHPDESLFYVHLLSLPFFAMVSFSDLGHHWSLFAESALQWFNTENMPTLNTLASNQMAIVYLILTVLTQYACIRYVYKLTTECASLTVTLVVTIRKFVSIIFSVIYFGNPFTYAHWFGTLVVFSGTFLFTTVDLNSKKSQDSKALIKQAKSQKI